MARPARSQAREDARGEFVEAAWQLFSHRGYDATPVSAIIDKVGLSKGAFYYYFASKEEILDAVVVRIVDEISAAVEPIPSDAALPPLEKMRRFIQAISDWKVANMNIIRETAEVVYRDENVIIRHKMNSRVVGKLSPVLAEIISQGIAERTFDAEEAEDTAEMILRFINAMAEMQAASFVAAAGDPGELELIMRRSELSMSAIEKMLGVRKGALFKVDAALKKKVRGALKG